MVQNGWHYMKHIDMDLYQTIDNAQQSNVPFTLYESWLKGRKKLKKKIFAMSTSNWGPNICRQDDEWTCVSKMLLGFSLSRPILLGVLFRFKATIITIIIMIHNCYVIKLIHDDPFHFLPQRSIPTI